MLNPEEQLFSQFPVLKNDRFILREIKLSDAENFFHYMTNSHVSKFLSAEDLPKDLAGAVSELGYWRSLFITHRSIYWGIEIDNRLVGTCGYNNWSRVHKKCEISYDLSYQYWGKGIMTEVIAIITEFAFKKMLVNRVQATAAIDNIGSIRVLEKNEFKREGTLAKYGILNNVVKDYYIYSKVN